MFDNNMNNKLNNIKHFIITRFNCRLTVDTSKYDKKLFNILDKDWLDDRFSKLQKYCCTSMKNQINQNFTWLVLIHEDTPRYYLDKFKKYKNFVPFYVKDDDNWGKTGYKNYIKNYIKKNKDITLILSRIDSDDMLSKNYVDYIQNNLAISDKKKNKIINFEYGICFNTVDGTSKEKKVMDSHYTTSINYDLNNIIYLFDYNHSNLHKIKKKIYYNIKKDKPMWLEISHDTNILNNIIYKSLPTFVNFDNYKNYFF